MEDNIRSRVLDKRTVAQMVEYIKDGGSYFRAARVLNVTHSTLMYHCRKAGVVGIHKIGRIKKGEQLLELPEFEPWGVRKKRIKEVGLKIDPLPSRFDNDSSWYLFCLMRSKMSKKKKKEIKDYYNAHKEDSQPIIYNVNMGDDFSGLELC